MNKPKARTHGLRYEPCWHILNNIRQRCYNPNRPDYKWYGGRGITVCDEWMGRQGLTHFNKWLTENGYKKGLTVDRIDGNRDYEPGNCRLATLSEQQRNKNCNIRTHGELAIDIAKQNGINKHTFYSRIQRGWGVEKAVATPPRVW